jgi:hypothetical protein
MECSPRTGQPACRRRKSVSWSHLPLVWIGLFPLGGDEETLKIHYIIITVLQNVKSQLDQEDRRKEVGACGTYEELEDASVLSSNMRL